MPINTACDSLPPFFPLAVMTSPLDKLPIELVDAIVEFLPAKALKSLALASALFRHPCQRCLFCNVAIRRPLLDVIPQTGPQPPSLSDFPTSPRLLANIASLTVAFARAHGWPDEPAFSTALSAIAAHGNVRRLAVMGTGPWAWLAPDTRAALLAILNDVQLRTLKMHDVLAFPAAEMYHLLSRGVEKTLVLSGCTYRLHEATGLDMGVARVQSLVLRSNLDEAYAMLASTEAPSLQNITKLSLRHADVDLRHNTLFNSTSIAHGLVELTLICYTLDAPGVVLPAAPRLQRLEVRTHMSWILPYGVAPTLAALPSSLQRCVFVFTLAISNPHRFYPSAEQYALFAADDSRGPPSAVAVELVARVVNGHAGVELDVADEEMVWEEFQDVVRRGFEGSKAPVVRRTVAELDGFEDD
ncbi:hypothetical protein MIND_00409800 [Mycena indigotica]|uniref:F-box domain-containing protein n=1 Tax=Mycena indigotica TaxID=2126181 RepID=A0A8H6SW32_9AGAR|nr:uncharacterized protein MIND_00409800 [Mycena indigotica]KAF7306195.1 hypothetical protein MIND_00409800 [Mycena indigotica]